RRLLLAPILGLTDFANATVGQIAQTLEELGRKGGAQPSEQRDRWPAGIDSWVRPFVMQWIPSPLQLPNNSTPANAGAWQVLAPDSHPLSARLRERLTRCPGSGLVVCLPTSPDETHIPLLLEAARAVFKNKEIRFVLVHQGRGAASFARSLHLENP